MKKMTLIFALFLLFPITVFAQEYNDHSAKVKYEINSNIWSEQSLSTERETIQKKWTNDDCGVLMYGSVDLWSKMSSSEKSGYTRSSFNHQVLTASDLDLYEETLEDMGYNIYSSNLVYYGIKMMKYSGYATYNGYEFDYLAFITINNGYMIQWQYYGETDTICTSRVTTAINSTLSTDDDTSSGFDFNLFGILIGIILTAVCYMGYPFVQMIILKKEYKEETCKKMALWNSIVIGAIFMILTIALEENVTWSGAPAFMYYWINKSLWHKKKVNVQNESERPEVTVCSCGCKVLKEFKKCPKCGRKM